MTWHPIDVDDLMTFAEAEELVRRLNKSELACPAKKRRLWACHPSGLWIVNISTTTNQNPLATVTYSGTVSDTIQTVLS